jgi:MarR family transcriptional regulator, organic hydroperoxide resistance regulator
MSPGPAPPLSISSGPNESDELLELLRSTYLLLKRRQRAILRESGLSLSEWSALQWCELGTVRGGELAEAIGLTSAGITDLVDRLEQRQLVRRIRDPEDRRAVRIELTEGGLKFHRDLRHRGEGLLRALTAQLTPAEYRSLTSGLRALARADAATESTPVTGG